MTVTEVSLIPRHHDLPRRRNHFDVGISRVPKVRRRVPVGVPMDDLGVVGARYISGVLPGVGIKYRGKIYDQRWIDLR